MDVELCFFVISAFSFWWTMLEKTEIETEVLLSEKDQTEENRYLLLIRW